MYRRAGAAIPLVAFVVVLSYLLLRAVPASAPAPTPTATLPTTATVTAPVPTPTATETALLPPSDMPIPSVSPSPLFGSPETPTPTPGAFPTAPIEAPLATPATTNAHVDYGVEGLRLRTRPGAIGEVTLHLGERTPLDVVGRVWDSQWVQVVIPDGRMGWVMAQYVDFHIDVEALPVTGTAVNFMLSTGLDGAPLPPFMWPPDALAAALADYPSSFENGGGARARDYDHDPLFLIPPVDPDDVSSWRGFGPQNFAFLLNETTYYGYAAGMHSGIDFSVPAGAPLYAVDWGEVVHVSYRENDNPYRAGPYSVIVRYGNHVALYGHMRGYAQGVDMFVNEGDIVGPGDLLGLSGTYLSYDHLHFELRSIAQDYIQELQAGASFGLREWWPSNYYINPALFFVEPLDGYGWPPKELIEEDQDENGYPDPYHEFSVLGIPPDAPDFWEESTVTSAGG